MAPVSGACVMDLKVLYFACCTVNSDSVTTLQLVACRPTVVLDLIETLTKAD